MWVFASFYFKLVYIIHRVPKIDNDFSVLIRSKVLPKSENCRLKRPCTAGVDSRSPQKLRYFFTQASTIYLKNPNTGKDNILYFSQDCY